MKNAFLIVFTFLNGLITYGQVEKSILKGNFTLGGNIGYSITSQRSAKFEDSDNREFNFSPSVGYFFFNRLVIGFSPSVSRSKSSSESHQRDEDYFLLTTYSSNTTSLGLAPFVKYYFNNGFFVMANIKYSKNWVESDQITDGYTMFNSDRIDMYRESTLDCNYRSLGFGLGLGYAYFINSKVSIDCSLNYQREKEIRTGESSSRNSNSSPSFETDISGDFSKSNYFIGIGLNVFL
jgi:hypothetical protein